MGRKKFMQDEKWPIGENQRRVVWLGVEGLEDTGRKQKTLGRLDGGVVGMNMTQRRKCSES